ncbi:MAG: hypothetical protein HAW59_00595, partial [Betaproteobacteria bacterium]|nr:hypothetical protein [Betaproteobacteria bacterium]
MKLHHNDFSGGNVIDGCGAGYVQINGARREKSVLLSSVLGVIAAELPSSAAALAGEDLRPLAELDPRPEVFLLGAGEHSPAIKMEWLAVFAKIGASLEVMSLHDNIPGVPSVGPKTAIKWLGEFD